MAGQFRHLLSPIVAYLKLKGGIIMMTLEQAKEYTREMLKPYYTDEEIEKTVNSYISVVRPGVVLAESNAGKIEIYL